MIQSIGASTALSTDRAATTRGDDAANPDAFAGILASMVQTAAPKPAEAKAGGTSELDHSDEATNDDDSPSDSATVRDDRSSADSPASRPARSMASHAAANEVVRSIAALDPQLQSKLSRVIARVQQETGHDVTVTETYRSQARQDALYAQGRATPGQVVTWTQSSKHSQGRAVDVALDGGTASPQAYEALQRIAREEGLRTLGARDPGHLELRGSGANAADATPNTPDEPADATGPGQVSIARLATLARVRDVAATPAERVTLAVRPPHTGAVAQVAQVATVARVATVAPAATNGTARPAPAVTMAIHSPAGAKTGSTLDRNSGGSTGSGAGDDARNGQSGGTGYQSLAAGFSRADSTTSSSTQPAAPVAAAAGSDAVARAERVLSAMESAPARSLSQITMSVDAGNGAVDRVRVSLRGAALDTTIDTGDNRVAQLLRSRTDELSSALSRDGIELRELRVRAAAETGTVTGAAAGQSAQSSADGSTHSRFDRGNAWQKQQDQQDQQDRQRSQDRGRQQQRQRRGGEQ